MNFLSSRALGTGLAALAGLGIAVGAASPVNAAGAAFAVDTADVGDPGNCKVEAWTSWAKNRDGLATVNPSCIVDTFTATEISLQGVRSRSDDEWSTSLTPKAKFRGIPTAIGSFGVAFAAGGSYDPKAHETTQVFAYVPATYRFSDTFRINLNGGWLQDRTSDQNYATYGAGFDWRWTETVTFTAETFGQTGKSDDAGLIKPRYQTGLRYRPIDTFSVDAIYGYNINGENSHWWTLSTTIRFPPK
jgi:hypothetical protein